MKKVRRIGYKKLSPAEFAVIWNNADSPEQVAQIAGTSMQNVYDRAKRFRRKGIKMKHQGNYLRTIEQINEVKALVGEIEDPLDTKAILEKYL